MLENIEPKSVFSYFEEICSIPHGSGNTRQISDYLAEFARQRNLEYYQDGLNNIIIINEASEGYEAAPALVIQGHMDMVCEKAADCAKNMETEGLDLAVAGDWIYALGTTLGGDDGIAVAMGLALLDDMTIKHPRLECVFTVDEETGMEGAAGIDLSPLKGRMLINLDSEAEGSFCVSCAGGAEAHCSIGLNRAHYEGSTFLIKIQGLIGGHSGVEIDKGRANADMLLGRYFGLLSRKTDYRIISAAGGLKDNAIPASAEVILSVSDVNAASNAADELRKMLSREYKATDPNIEVIAEPAQSKLMPVDREGTEKIAAMLMCLPNGIYEMSADVKGLVQTSLNLGILKTSPDELMASFCIRSSIDSQKYMLIDRLECFMKLIGGQFSLKSVYPGWAFLRGSRLQSIMIDEFKKQYGREPIVEAIHAGVECGLLLGKLPDLDCVSIGPDLTEIHTPREKMSISSVQRTWKFLISCVERIAELNN